MSRRSWLRRLERRAPRGMSDETWLAIFRWAVNLDSSGGLLAEFKESLGAPRHLQGWETGGGEEEDEYQAGPPPHAEQPGPD